MLHLPRSIIMLLALWRVLAGWSEPPATGPTTQPREEPATVRGVILHVNGEPAEGVRVRLAAQSYEWVHRDPRARVPAPSPRGGYRALTDSEGRFEFKNVPYDAYSLIGGHKGIGWVLEFFYLESGQTLELSLTLQHPPTK